MALKYKMKGAFWYPDPANYAKSISESQPPAWHKDLGNLVSIKAAVAAMTLGIEPEAFIRAHFDVYDFLLRIKVGRADELYVNRQPVQRTTRYYVAKQGGMMVKVSPPAKGAQVGTFKRANGVSDYLWSQVNAELQASNRAGEWDGRIHTKNKSTHQMRETQIEAGYKIATCNDVREFSFANVDYTYYVAEAEKLIV